jgi:hypothetical protein
MHIFLEKFVNPFNFWFTIFLVLEVACLVFILEYHHGTSKGLMRSFSGLLDRNASVKLPFGAITRDKFAEVTQAIEKMSQ